MENTEIRPALTPEQWRALDRGEPVQDSETTFRLLHGDISVFDGDYETSSIIDADDRHMAAAICLHRQPEGFTRYDVWLLRHAAEHARPAHPELNDLADRIAALLPPE